MRRALSILLFSAASVFFVGCLSDGVADKGQYLESCYDTGQGLHCVSTPNELVMQPTDVDGDAILDIFVCGDGASDSDSDGDLENSDNDDGVSEEGDVDDDEPVAASDDGEDDGEDDGDDAESDSDSDSDSDCGVSDADDEGSDSDSDADNDGDADEVSDEVDCDCVDLPPPTDGGGTDPGVL